MRLPVAIGGGAAVLFAALVLWRGLIPVVKHDPPISTAAHSVQTKMASQRAGSDKMAPSEGLARLERNIASAKQDQLAREIQRREQERKRALGTALVLADRDARILQGGNSRGIIRADVTPLQPFFPWPPPVPSASRIFHASAFPKFVLTFRDLSEYLESRLSERGYKELRYYGVGDDGFALVTRLEKIDNSGRPLAGDARWPKYSELDSIELRRKHFSIAAYLAALLRPGEFKEETHYRIFVFIATPRAISPNRQLEVNSQTIRGWETLGSLSLDTKHANMPFTKGVNVSVLIYELVSAPPDRVKLALPSSLPGDVQLAAAGIVLETKQ